MIFKRTKSPRLAVCVLSLDKSDTQPRFWHRNVVLRIAWSNSRYGIPQDRNGSIHSPLCTIGTYPWLRRVGYTDADRNAQAAVVVYDITKSASLTKAQSWIKELQRQASPGIIIALAGNKLDLADDEENGRQVSYEEGKEYANETGALFFETSAKSGAGVQELFTEIGLSCETSWTDL